MPNSYNDITQKYKHNDFSEGERFSSRSSMSVTEMTLAPHTRGRIVKTARTTPTEQQAICRVVSVALAAQTRCPAPITVCQITGSLALPTSQHCSEKSVVVVNTKLKSSTGRLPHVI